MISILLCTVSIITGLRVSPSQWIDTEKVSDTLPNDEIDDLEHHAHDEDHNLEHNVEKYDPDLKNSELCADDELDSIIAPAVKDIVDCAKEMKLTVYPAAISSLGALRYGGNSVLVDNKRKLMDHDLDLIGIGPPDSKMTRAKFTRDIFQITVKLIKKGWRMPQLNFTDLVWTSFTLASLQARQVVKGYFDDEGHEFLGVSWRKRTPPNEMTLKLHREYSRLGIENLKEISPQSEQPALDEFQSNTAQHDASTNSEMPITPTNHLSYIHIDFFGISGLQDEWQPHPAKKLLFHTISLPFPKNSNLLVFLLQNTFWDKRSASSALASAHKLCAFSGFSSQKGYTDDVDGTAENRKIAIQCSAALAAQGYESFHTFGCMFM